ncbi:MAG: 4-oxalocrotonate tautomerase family protein [Endomicrobiaceae bacterium]
MPVITVKIAKGRELKTKREFVKAVTDSAVKILKVKNEWVTALIEEFDRKNWASGGELHSDKFGKGFGKKTKKK